MAPYRSGYGADHDAARQHLQHDTRRPGIYCEGIRARRQHPRTRNGVDVLRIATRFRATFCSRCNARWRSVLWARYVRTNTIASWLRDRDCMGGLHLVELSGIAAQLHHHALYESGRPFWLAALIVLGAWQLMTAAMMLPSSLGFIRYYAATAGERRIFLYDRLVPERLLRSVDGVRAGRVHGRHGAPPYRGRVAVVGEARDADTRRHARSRCRVSVYAPQGRVPQSVPSPRDVSRAQLSPRHSMGSGSVSATHFTVLAAAGRSCS